MPTTVVVHIAGEDPLVAELEELPGPTDQSITLMNPRRRDNKPARYIADDAISVIFPMHRINFIEVMPGEGDTGELDLFFRA